MKIVFFKVPIKVLSICTFEIAQVKKGNWKPSGLDKTLDPDAMSKS